MPSNSNNQWPLGTRVRFVDPRPDQRYMLNWEGEVISPRYGENTVQVRLVNPDNPSDTHTEGYYRIRLEEVVEPIGSAIARTIHRLQKRQKFYQTYKQQLPTWFASYGD